MQGLNVNKLERQICELRDQTAYSMGLVNTELIELLQRYETDIENRTQIIEDIYRITVLENKYIPHKPTPKQEEFLKLLIREAFYGGACGGGKSDALLMAALMFVEIPDYSAILFRRTFRDLALPSALMSRAKEWLMPTDAHWSEISKCWTFPSGAKLAFGYLAGELDKYSYQSAEFQFIGFDELTQFEQDPFRYMFSRLRRLSACYVPLRMRGASNPGGIGHNWVKQWFLVEGKTYNRRFIPARLKDNPHLDQDAYIENLNTLDPITRRQYLEGDWTAKHGANKFKREWFKTVNVAPSEAMRVRYWDMAATTPSYGKDPDYTVGLKLAFLKGVYYIEDVIRVRVTPQQQEQIIKQAADIDGSDCKVYMEQEPGSEGISLINHYSRNILTGYAFHGAKSTGSKEIRANPVSSAAEAGNIFVVTGGTWLDAFLDELESFPYGSHDDQVDALSGAFHKNHGPMEFSHGKINW
jgi:predicted phage terminase large subunit-like protein